MSTLEIDAVSVARGGRTVVRGVSFSVTPGEVTALLGANGAGKTSLVEAVAGLIPLDSGSVRVGGDSIGGRPPHRIRAAGVAAVPEGHRVFESLSVLENLRAAGSRLPKRDLSAGVDGAMALFPELEALQGQLAGSLSGGQQQMVAIAGALVDPPDFLLIDELSLGLAPVVVRRMIPAVREIASRGVGILLVEQFATIALELATRVAVLDRGQIAFYGEATELADDEELLLGAYLAG